MDRKSDFRILDSGNLQSLDLIVVALGYEQRSVHVAKSFGTIADRKLALAFAADRTLAFDDNSALLTNLGFDIVPVEEEIGQQIASHILNLPEDNRAVGVDISSFTRRQMAQIVEATIESALEGLTVDFFYAPAKSDGWEEETGAITVAEPIHPAFTSWTDDPTRPLAALIGVGVEDNLALGVAEFLDVSSVHAFVPVGGDPGFDPLNDAANYDFFGTNYVVNRSDYDVLRPFELFTRLESLVYGIAPDTRVAIVPLGPKIFALCGLLATAVLGRAATVWRFSWIGAEEPCNRIAAGPITSLRLEYPLDRRGLPA